MALNFLIQLAIMVALQLVSALLRPKPKRQKSEAAKDLEDPVAEAGKPIPIIFGPITVKGLNVLDFRDKSTNVYKVKV